ncbi:DUF2842 domain-containing protein [Yoonia sp. BS5-3]|uniref:DUF2842 domain-containing protein n=1 Tax=Yoonia phaeophyticola TaxID=3137369 RepID=A0ABZ2UZU7_9RHOB
MRYKARKRLALFVLVVGLPAYIVVAATIMSQASRFPLALELLTYIVLGIGWVFPLKRVFIGIGQVDPDAENDQ